MPPAWPDIDVNICYDANDDMIFALRDWVEENMNPTWFESRCTQDEPESPGQYFLGFEVTRDNATWNFDFWVLDEANYQRSLEWLKRMRQTLTEETRSAIVAIKHALIDRKFYPGKIPSIQIYDAVLHSGIRSYEDFAKLTSSEA